MIGIGRDYVPPLEVIVGLTQALTLHMNENSLSSMRSEAPALMPIFRSRHMAEIAAAVLLNPRRFTLGHVK
jgi:hypothetical protein